MKAAEFIIRLMQEEDIQSLTETFCFPWDTLQATKEKWQRYYTEQQNHIRIVKVLELNHQLIGYGSLFFSPEYPSFRTAGIPEINDVWILEQERNKGYGKKLIQALEDIAAKEGYQIVGIGVGLYKDYGVAQKLYVQMGYIPDGRGITYKCKEAISGQAYPLDDELILWLTKALK